MENQLPSTFHALGDPTRFAVVERLLEGPASVSELAEPHDMVLSAFTKHLGVLEGVGLITSEKRGRVRICAISPAAMTTLATWFEDRRAMWERRLDRLEAHLSEPKSQRKD